MFRLNKILFEVDFSIKSTKDNRKFSQHDPSPIDCCPFKVFYVRLEFVDTITKLIDKITFHRHFDEQKFPFVYIFYDSNEQIDLARIKLIRSSVPIKN